MNYGNDKTRQKSSRFLPVWPLNAVSTGMKSAPLL